MVQIEVEIEFVLDPAIQSFNNRIVSRGSTTRHGTQYVILIMGLGKSLGRIDSALVGVENYRGLLFFLFTCELIQNSQAVIVRFVTALNICDTVSKDLIVKGIQEKCPFPILLSDLQHCHVRHNDLSRLRSIPTTLYFIGKDPVSITRRLVRAFSCTGMNAGILTAFMSQIV